MRAGKSILYMFLAIIAVLALMYVMSGNGGSPSLETRARQAVEAQGYTVIEPRGYEVFACGSEAHGFNYLVEMPNGTQANITACTDQGVLGINKSFWLVTR
jgi:hypothetical protein